MVVATVQPEQPPSAGPRGVADNSRVAGDGGQVVAFQVAAEAVEGTPQQVVEELQCVVEEAAVHEPVAEDEAHPVTEFATEPEHRKPEAAEEEFSGDSRSGISPVLVADHKRKRNEQTLPPAPVTPTRVSTRKRKIKTFDD